MDDKTVTRYLVDELDGVIAVESAGDVYFAYEPSGELPDGPWSPFATIMTGDRYDQVSELDRDGAYRLNLGLPRATYRSLFGAPPSRRDDRGVFDTGFDYAARDVLMPHPVYASQYWVCVVAPSEDTCRAVRPLVAEAHGLAARKHAHQQARRSGGDE